MPVIEISALRPRADLDVPAALAPAIVRVFANRPPEHVAGLLEVVGAAVVRALALDDGNVFVRFEPADPARMFWG